MTRAIWYQKGCQVTSPKLHGTWARGLGDISLGILNNVALNSGQINLGFLFCITVSQATCSEITNCDMRL